MFTSRLIFKIYIDKLHTQRLVLFSKKEIVKAIKNVINCGHSYLTEKLKYIYFLEIKT
jgi:hypothetical protein